ncbi:MAG TPA: tripartite tricarboxylate transporter substrate binding protein, partial [Vineibacter sp.]|nr:tripartite tricarboxylate transporter substrate binding protein [Vineibacter sp.]
AQTFPDKPLRFVIPFPAGGIVDIVGRSVGEKLATLLGQPVVIDNRPGGNSAIATDIVAKAPPDGHTWLLATVSHTVAPHLQKVTFDPIGDFAGVAYLANVPAIAVVPIASRFRSMAEVVESSKVEPGRLRYLNPGAGTSIHLNMELLRQRTGAVLTGIPYRGLPPGIPDLLEGRIDLALLSPPLCVPHIRAGKLRALAVAGNNRHRDLPDVPTFTEAGLSDSVVESWYVILVPARTPKQRIARLHAATVEALQDPEVLKKLDSAAAVPPTRPVSPADVGALIERDFERYGELVRTAGIKADG